MNKKTKLKLELEETIKTRVASSEDCPECHQHITCKLSMEAHKQLHPTHFSGVETEKPNKDEAILVDLKAKRYNKQ